MEREKRPSMELVPQTGHAETVHITYNVKKVSLERIAPALFPDYRPNVEESTK